MDTGILTAPVQDGIDGYRGHLDADFRAHQRGRIAEGRRAVDDIINETGDGE